MLDASKTSTGKSSTQTIERTGKPYKAMQLIGVLCLCAGVISCVAQVNNPQPEASLSMPLLFVLGIVLTVGGKVLGWWHHG
jgi:hypothetical protein